MGPTERIRERVLELLAQRSEVTDVEFGNRIGRGYSWVSAFRKGTRPATDIDLIVKIAKYLGVSVGYLLGETERTLDPGAATLLATYEQMTTRDRQLFLQIAATFRQPNDEAVVPPAGAVPQTETHTDSTAPPPRKRKHR